MFSVDKSTKLPKSAYRVARSDKMNFVADGKQLLVVGQKIELLDAFTGKALHSFNPLEKTSDATVNHAGDVVALKNIFGATVLWNIKQGAVCAKHTPKSDCEGVGLVFSPDDRLLIDAGWDGTITLRNTEDLKAVDVQERSESMIGDLAYLPNLEQFLVIRLDQSKDEPSTTLEFWSIENDKLKKVKQVTLEENPSSAYLSRNRKRLLLVGFESYEYDFSSERITVIPGLQPTMDKVSWSSDDSILACLTFDGVSFFETKQWKEVGQLVMKMAVHVTYSGPTKLIGVGNSYAKVGFVMDEKTIHELAGVMSGALFAE